MDVTEQTIGAAMNCVAAMSIEDIAKLDGIPVEQAAVEFLSSHTAEMLFDDDTKLWWDGPSAVVGDYMDEVGRHQLTPS